MSQHLDPASVFAHLTDEERNTWSLTFAKASLLGELANLRTEDAKIASAHAAALEVLARLQLAATERAHAAGLATDAQLDAIREIITAYNTLHAAA